MTSIASEAADGIIKFKVPAEASFAGNSFTFPIRYSRRTSKNPNNFKGNLYYDTDNSKKFNRGDFKIIDYNLGRKDLSAIESLPRPLRKGTINFDFKDSSYQISFLGSPIAAGNFNSIKLDTVLNIFDPPPSSDVLGAPLA